MREESSDTQEFTLQVPDGVGEPVKKSGSY